MAKGSAWRAHSAPVNQTNDTGPALEISGLEKAFGDVRAGWGLDLVVQRGEALGLLGPNGAGKTTTLRILSTLLAADAGTVRVLGLDPATDGADIRRRIGVVPQEVALYGGLTAEENLAFFGELAGLGGARLAERVDWALEAAGLADRRRARVSGFSGGMKRRLNLAAALLAEPELLFLDEPTAGSDPQSRNHAVESGEELRRGGTTIVYTTHQMGEVERLCDRIAVLDRGRCIAAGTLDELRRHEAVAASGAGPGLALAPDTDLERAVELLRASGIDADLRGADADLETIFLALTGRALRDDDGGDA